MATDVFLNNNKKESKLTHLAKLAAFLLCIPPSSAFIESCFSICGLIQKKNWGNMNPDLIEARGFLMANISTLIKVSKFLYIFFY